MGEYHSKGRKNDLNKFFSRSKDKRPKILFVELPPNKEN